MRDFLTITKALADRNRLRALCALRQQELCLCQIIELLNLASSTVSKHMSILHGARLVESRKDGRWVYFRLPGDNASADVREALAWVFSCLSRDRQIKDDRARLKQILKIDSVELCRRRMTK